jgi:hypothetical protein
MVYTNKQKFNKIYGQKLNQPNSKKDISKLTGVSMKILDDVYDRALAARINNPESVRSLSGKKVGGKSLKGKMSGAAWGFSRIYSFIVGAGARKSDADLWEKHLKNMKRKKQKKT